MRLHNYGWFFILAASSLHAQTPVYDSGGALTPEQAAYDIVFTDLTLTVSPADSSITGTMRMNAIVITSTKVLVLDLDPILEIKTITDYAGERPLDYDRRGGKVWIELGREAAVGENVGVVIEYGGRPRVAPLPPWSGGFTWATTPAGDPWITTTAQQEGPDIWWPTKDHVSDKPDSMALHITVPEPLVVAANGVLRSVDHSGDLATYHWFISTPISSYNVSLNIAPYRIIEEIYRSVAGDEFPVQFFVLPEDYDRGIVLFAEILQHLEFFERNLGPYPFRIDKYAAVQTPHLGMEHQSIIAYGANFDNGSMTGGVDWGFDALHHHEMSHEWWGNMVTNSDWKDMWLHEGFGTYMQPLYLEQTQGIHTYHAYMESLRGGISNGQAVAPRESQSAKEIYTGDIYSKGAWILHTLRHFIGDEAMANLLRRMAYPDPEMETVRDGRQTRFVTTDDFVALAERVSGEELGWFFEVYLRQPALPRLLHSVRDGKLFLQWEVAGDLNFSLSVDVRIGEDIERIDMAGGEAVIDISLSEDQIEIDPERWILMEDGR